MECPLLGPCQNCLESKWRVCVLSKAGSVGEESTPPKFQVSWGEDSQMELPSDEFCLLSNSLQIFTPNREMTLQLHTTDMTTAV